MKRILFSWLCAFWCQTALAIMLPNLIGGIPVDPTKYTASVYSTQGRARCSSTLIGPRVLIIAAHCISDSIETSFKAGGKIYHGQCEAAPGYARNVTADWALCLIDKAVTNVKFEFLNHEETLVKVGDVLQLTGYGCINPGGTGGNDGIYRIGSAKVISIPSRRSYDITTQSNVALCYGDSGGPLFKILEDGTRLIAGINSRGNIRDTSYLSSVANDEFKAFLKAWTEKNKVGVCGYHDVDGCRSI